MAAERLRAVHGACLEPGCERLPLEVVKRLCAPLEQVGSDELEGSFYQAYDEEGDGCLSEEDFVSGAQRLCQMAGMEPEALADSFTDGAHAELWGVVSADGSGRARLRAIFGSLASVAPEVPAEAAGRALAEEGDDVDQAELAAALRALAGAGVSLPAVAQALRRAARGEERDDSPPPPPESPESPSAHSPEPELSADGDGAAGAEQLAAAAEDEPPAEEPPAEQPPEAPEEPAAASPAPAAAPAPTPPPRPPRHSPAPGAAPVDFSPSAVADQEGPGSEALHIDPSTLTTGQRLYYCGCGLESLKQAKLQKERQAQVLAELSALSPPQITRMGRQASSCVARQRRATTVPKAGSERKDPLGDTRTEARADILVEDAVRAGLWLPAMSPRSGETFSNVGDSRTNATLMSRSALASFLLRQPPVVGDDGVALIERALADGLWQERRAPDGTLVYSNVRDGRTRHQTLRPRGLAVHLDKCRRTVSLSDRSNQILQHARRRYRGPVRAWKQHAARHQSRRQPPPQDPADFVPNINRSGLPWHHGESGYEASERLHEDARRRAEEREQQAQQSVARSQRDPETGCPLFVPNATRRSQQRDRSASASPYRTPAIAANPAPAAGPVAASATVSGPMEEQVVHRLLSAGQEHERKLRELRERHEQIEKPPFAPQLGERTRMLADSRRSGDRAAHARGSAAADAVASPEAPHSQPAGSCRRHASPPRPASPQVGAGRVSSAEAEAFLRRNARRLRQQQDRLSQLKRQQADKVLAHCTFRPRISHNSEIIAQRGWSRAAQPPGPPDASGEPPDGSPRTVPGVLSPPRLGSPSPLRSNSQSPAGGACAAAPQAVFAPRDRSLTDLSVINEFEREVEEVLQEWRKLTQ
eukprot:TRINITY_DN2726_c0_g1_i2.p1 TRINITY_DN2726_c0_g1~~TRINITY_DN2726_c0_g1_i2.p1  ORF type:complete len:907 (+),score=243.79 TRINITY_DN2726_c0_g1_i2:92-2722(+)